MHSMLGCIKNFFLEIFKYVKLFGKILSIQNNGGKSIKQNIKLLSNVSPEEAKGFLDSFDIIFCDCDGVLWFKNPIPGVGETIKKLTERNKDIYYISNNCTKTPEIYKEQFENIGVEINLDKLIHPGVTMVEYFRDINFEKEIYVIGSSSIQKCLTSAGYKCIVSEVSAQENLEWFLRNITDNPKIGAVVFDFDINFNFLKICRVLTILRRPDVHFLVGSTEYSIPIVDSLSFVGPGPLINLIQNLSKRTPTSMAKPGKYLKSSVLKKIQGTDPKRVLMIGDMMETDSVFGKMCGFQTLLVKTGYFQENQLVQFEESLHPDYVIESLGHLSEVIDLADKKQS